MWQKRKTLSTVLSVARLVKRLKKHPKLNHSIDTQYTLIDKKSKDTIT